MITGFWLAAVRFMPTVPELEIVVATLIVSLLDTPRHLTEPAGFRTGTVLTSSVS
jgi:hypothetical protein